MTKVFGETSTTDEVLSGVNLKGKRVLVTGVSSGLGVETARSLAAHGAQVVGAARDLKKADAATDQVRKDAAANGGSFEVIALDLASLTSVRECADALLKKGEPFDVIIANAGVMATPFGHTEDGFETQFGTNHLGHFVLANRIASAIVVEGGKKNIDPALLVGVVLTEDAKLDPNAKSFVGARGLMQVMPFHAGKWKGCSSADLFSIDSNICHGTSILADLIKRSPSVARALQRYNGCVKGTNTPNCGTYSGKVLKFAEQAATQMLSFSLSD